MVVYGLITQLEPRESVVVYALKVDKPDVVENDVVVEGK